MSARAMIVGAACGVLLTPLAASAQPTSNGPMTIERMHNGLLAAADVKVTEFDHRTSELLGGYGGWVMDDTILVGGAGYWLANGSRDRELAYGGLILQWMGHPKGRVGYGVKGLVGGGQATLTQTVTTVTRITEVDVRGLTVPGRFDVNQINRFPPTPIPPRTTTVRFRQNIFVAEPEANVFFRLNGRLRVGAGVGYRFVGADGDDSRFRGASGSLSLQIS